MKEILEKREDQRDNAIKEALSHKARKVSADDIMLREILNKAEQSKEVNNMKVNYKKIIIAACAVMVVGATGVFAGGLRFSSHASSDRREAINHFPTANEVKDAVGYVPKYVEELPGGYKFESAQPSDRTDKDEDGNVIYEGRAIEFYYDTGVDGAILTLSTDKGDTLAADSDPYNSEIINVDGVEVKYSSFTYMAVPPDYVPTADEKKAEEDGTLAIGYGSDKVEIINTQSLIWYEDGISYDLMDMGLEVNKDDFISMAEAVINS